MHAHSNGYYAASSAFHACAGKLPGPDSCHDGVSVSVSRASSQSLYGGISEQSCDSEFFSAFKVEALEQENDAARVRDQCNPSLPVIHPPPHPSRQQAAGCSLECSELLAGDAGIANARSSQPLLKRVAISDAELRSLIRNEKEKEREADLCVDEVYLRFHDESVSEDKFISPNMRTIAFGWLVEVCMEFRLQQETLFLAVRLADRFLSNSRAVPRNMLQLVAVTCVLLAAKQEEEVCPTVEQLCDIAANCFKAEDVLRMEMLVLDTLLWRTKMATPYTFLHLYAQAMPACSYSVVCLSSYLLELSLLEYSSLQHQPSALAAAALMLAQLAHQQPTCSDQLSGLSGHSPGALRDSADLLMRLHYIAWGATEHSPAQPMVAIRSKYDQPAFCHVSRLPPGVAYAHVCVMPRL